MPVSVTNNSGKLKENLIQPKNPEVPKSSEKSQAKPIKEPVLANVSLQEAQFVEEELPADFWASETFAHEPLADSFAPPHESYAEAETLFEAGTLIDVDSTDIGVESGESRADNLENEADPDLLFSKFQSLFPGKIIRIETLKESTTTEDEDSEAANSLFDETQVEGA